MHEHDLIALLTSVSGLLGGMIITLRTVRIRQLKGRIDALIEAVAALQELADPRPAGGDVHNE